MQTYEVIIIGTGGGAKIASALAKLGRRVALIEKDKAGGTCLNRGCIPSKMLIHPASQLQRIRALPRLKIQAEIKTVDFEALLTGINTYTDGLSDSIDTHFEHAETVDSYRGEARFVSDREVQVGDHRITAPRIVIATGSRPRLPSVPGLEGTPFLTSTEALRARAGPPRLAVLGSGYIAAELGGAYAGFGSLVTFIARSTFLRREDKEIIEVFKKGFFPGKTILENTAVRGVAYEENRFRIEVEAADGARRTVEAEALLVATGVRPNSDALGLAHTAIKTDEGGYIRVDDDLQTTVPGVYAIGDVAGNYLFRHSVNFEAEYWIQAHFFSESPPPIDYPPMPSAVFTHPEIASVGWTEEEAARRGVSVTIGKAAYPSCTMALARGLEIGLVKLIFEKETGVLKGAHIVGEEASTLIQELVLAATVPLTAEQIYRQIYIHPAFPEVVRNALRNALCQLDKRYDILF